MTVGERLKNLRLNAKRTLKRESDIFNVSLNTVYRWEHNLTIPKKSVLKKIANFYDVSFEWLTHGNIDENNNRNHKLVSGEFNCEGCTLHTENYAEQQLLYMFKKLSENNKYKILGYIERIYVESVQISQ
ncbi:MAG: helix-turn-helix transcriptional regulator [Oscillospiraceae bacterium]|nr:helix-turn-helix transcriptional regulator [Oscillospiraceae bacterium]